MRVCHFDTPSFEVFGHFKEFVILQSLFYNDFLTIADVEARLQVALHFDALKSVGGILIHSTPRLNSSDAIGVKPRGV